MSGKRMTASRMVSWATAGYAVYSLARPEHLADAMDAGPDKREDYERLARVYGVRDLTIGLLGALGPRKAVPVAMGLRLASDVADAGLLGTQAPTDQARKKALGAALGWAVLNAGALARDVRRS